jgi:uncharacterized protein with GYD domain
VHPEVSDLPVHLAGCSGLADRSIAAHARCAVRKTVESLGGHLESFDFAFGEDDTYVLCEMPDQRAARQTLDYRPPGD